MRTNNDKDCSKTTEKQLFSFVGITMKAGDILAINDNSSISKLIRAGTISNWSHVGIATSNNTVLEATKLHKFAPSSPDEINETTLNNFIYGSNELIHLIRPTSLSENQFKLLEEFKKYAKNRNYTTIHALFTVIPWLILTILIFLFLWEFFRIGTRTLSSGGNIIAFIISMAITALSIFILYKFMLWSSRTTFGVKFTEQIYYKTKIGRWLVDKKYDMFCSKLVVLADKAIGGPLSEKLPYAEEVQPTDIVKACTELGWDKNVFFM